MFSFHITNYNVWFVIRNGCVSLNLLIPQYGYFASLACFYWFWYMFVPVFLCLIVPLFPYICWSIVVHTLYRVFLCTVLLPVWGMPILYGLLSLQTVGIFCICYLSLCLISSLHNLLLLLLIFMYPKYIRSRIIVILVKWVQTCKWIYSRYFTEVLDCKLFPWVTVQMFFFILGHNTEVWIYGNVLIFSSY
jgi:hypothetical protein